MAAYFNCYFFIRAEQDVRFFVRLLSNQVNKGFEASSNETSKLSISFAIAYDVLPSGFIKTTDYRPTDTRTTYHLLNDPPTTYSPIYVKIEDQILNM